MPKILFSELLLCLLITFFHGTPVWRIISCLREKKILSFKSVFAATLYVWRRAEKGPIRWRKTRSGTNILTLSTNVPVPLCVCFYRMGLFFARRHTLISPRIYTANAPCTMHAIACLWRRYVQGYAYEYLHEYPCLKLTRLKCVITDVQFYPTNFQVVD
jgi:hypothetical protein